LPLLGSLRAAFCTYNERITLLEPCRRFTKMRTLQEYCRHSMNVRAFQVLVTRALSQAALWFALLGRFTLSKFILARKTDQDFTHSLLPPIKRLSTMASTTTSILELPPELILVIGDYLPRDCILALKLTRRKFNGILLSPPLPKNMEPSECERLFTLSHESRDPTRRRCVRCKLIFDLKFFDSVGTPTEVPASVVQAAQRAESVSYPEGLCWKEAGSLLKIVYTGPGGKAGWTSQKDTWCMHCGSVQGWNKCNCNCNSCPRKTVRTYTHYRSENRNSGKR
jgi:hypothetical protein